MTMHMSPLRNLLLQDVAPRCCSEMCSLCRLCCVPPALCPAWPGPVRLTPSNPRNYRIAESPNRRGAHFDRITNREALARDSARFGQPCILQIGAFIYRDRLVASRTTRADECLRWLCQPRSCPTLCQAQPGFQAVPYFSLSRAQVGRMGLHGPRPSGPSAGRSSYDAPARPARGDVIAGCDQPTWRLAGPTSSGKGSAYLSAS